MAHSRGGAVVAALAEAFVEDFREHVFFVAFTASTDTLKKGESESAKLLQGISVNYETSEKALGTPLPDNGRAIQKVKKLTVSKDNTNGFIVNIFFCNFL